MAQPKNLSFVSWIKPISTTFYSSASTAAARGIAGANVSSLQWAYNIGVKSSALHFGIGDGSTSTTVELGPFTQAEHPLIKTTQVAATYVYDAATINTIRHYSDGRFVTSATTYSYMPNMVSGGMGFQGRYHATDYGLIMNMALSSEQVASLYADRWQMFRQPLRRFYSVPGGGVVTGGSAALAGAGALTLAGVRLLAATRALAGAGAATGTPARLRAAGVSLAGSGSVALGGARLRAVIAALNGAGYVGILGAAECQGHATLTIGSARVKVAAVVAAGAAGLTVGSVRLVAANAALHGAGALAAAVAGTNSILIAFLGAGTQGAAALGEGTQTVVTRGSGTQTIEEVAP
jgi:hypothetical protein